MGKGKPQPPKARLSRDHQTYIPLAKTIRDKARGMEGITMISSGLITGGVRPAEQRVKICTETGCILLVVRGTTAVQELRIYSHDLPRTRLDIARMLRNNDIRISFEKAGAVRSQRGS